MNITWIQQKSFKNCFKNSSQKIDIDIKMQEHQASFDNGMVVSSYKREHQNIVLSKEMKKLREHYCLS